MAYTKKVNWESWKIFAEKLADKLMDAANITFGALVVGQFLAGKEFSWPLAGVGLGIWIILYILSYIVVRFQRGG